MTEIPQNRRRSRIVLILITSMFVLPLAVAAWLYQQTETGKPWGTSNKGDLITPAVPLKAFSLQASSEQELSLESLLGKWTLTYMPALDCDDVCKRNIYHMRQVWAGLGREAHRVQRLVVFSQATQLETNQEFLQFYPDLLLGLDVDNATGFSQQFSATEDQRDSTIYLIDPLGNVMMSFSQDLDPRDMLKDIKKLLKISKIG